MDPKKKPTTVTDEDAICVNQNLRKMREDYRGLTPAGLPWAFGAPAPELAALVRDGVIAPASTVVDLGCGQGTEAVFLAAQGMPVIGIDAIQDALKLAEELARHYGVRPRWVRANLLALPLVAECADVALDSFVFHHLQDPVRDPYARELSRVLRPGGLLVLRAYSDGIADGEGPRRLRSEEILSTFMPYFACEHLERIRGLRPTHPIARELEPLYWFALFRRKTSARVE